MVYKTHSAHNIIKSLSFSKVYSMDYGFHLFPFLFRVLARISQPRSLRASSAVCQCQRKCWRYAYIQVQTLIWRGSGNGNSPWCEGGMLSYARHLAMGSDMNNS